LASALPLREAAPFPLLVDEWQVIPEVLGAVKRAVDEGVGAVRDPTRLRHYLQAIAASTAGTPTLKTLLDVAGIERPTASAYDALLERLLVTPAAGRGCPGCFVTATRTADMRWTYTPNSATAG
jgi:hypothetical protein